MRQARCTVSNDEYTIYGVAVAVSAIPVLDTLLRHDRFGGVATLGLIVICLSLAGLARSSRGSNS